jgi:hypothetical protein
LPRRSDELPTPGEGISAITRVGVMSLSGGGRALAVGTLDAVPEVAGGEALRIVVCDARTPGSRSNRRVAEPAATCR